MRITLCRQMTLNKARQKRRLLGRKRKKVRPPPARRNRADAIHVKKQNKEKTKEDEEHDQAIFLQTRIWFASSRGFLAQRRR
jgi:hypothetical protein